MRPVTLSQTGVGTTSWARMDWRKTQPAFTVAFEVTGTVTFNGEWTPDDPPSTVFTDQNVSAATANCYSTWQSPVQYYRLNVTAGTGTVTMKIITGG